MAHPCLPKSIDKDLLPSWLKNNAKESYSEEKRIYYTEEEIQSFKDTAVSSGIEINNLLSLKASITKRIEKGDEEDLTIDIPSTLGVKGLKALREDCERQVEKGYRVVHIKIYGIPYQEENSMVFFDPDGVEFTDRTRPLSAKEIREYFGIFANPNYTVSLTNKQA